MAQVQGLSPYAVRLWTRSYHFSSVCLHFLSPPTGPMTMITLTPSLRDVLRRTGSDGLEVASPKPSGCAHVTSFQIILQKGTYLSSHIREDRALQGSDAQRHMEEGIVMIHTVEDT